MFMTLPFAYRATVRTHMRARKAKRLFRSEATFEIPEIAASDLREAVRVTYSKRVARKTGCANDVVFAHGDRLYRPVRTDGDPFLATELATCLATDSGFPFLSSDAQPPPLPVLAREGYVKLSGFGRLPSIDEASVTEGWHFRAVLAHDRYERFAEAYLHYSSALLAVDGHLYVGAPEPAWHYVGTSTASYRHNPSRWHPWMFEIGRAVV